MHKKKLCNLGNFYVAIGKDATLLNNLLGLKVSCVKPEVCKVGFPVCALEKYTELLVQKRYSFIVYDFDQKKEELKILESYEGKNKNKLTIGISRSNNIFEYTYFMQLKLNLY